MRMPEDSQLQMFHVISCLHASCEQPKTGGHGVSRAEMGWNSAGFSP
jgi:hypothetical protein